MQSGVDGRASVRSQRSALHQLTPLALIYVALAGVLLAAGFGLLIVIAAGMFFAALGTLLFVQPSLAELAIYLTCGFAFTTSWNSVHLGPLRPSDMFLISAMLCFVVLWIREPIPQLPWWLLVLIGGIVLIATAHELWAQNITYLNSRVRVNAAGFQQEVITTNLAQSSKWLVSLLLVPLATCGARLLDTRSTNWIACCMATGTAMSGAVAISDRLHITRISSHLVSTPTEAKRQLGLTLHPNHLSTACIIALPLAVWMLGRRENTTRLIAVGAVIGCAAGAYLSGSRSGAVAALAAAAAGAVVVPRVRRQLPYLVPFLVLGAAAAFLFVPGLAAEVGKTTRLTGTGTSASGSDAVRRDLATQAWEDFTHSSVDGIGLQIITNAHDIYLQMLAAGGILLLGAFLVFSAGSLLAALRVGRTNVLGLALLTSWATFLLAALVSNILLDRYLYVSVGLIAALAKIDGPETREVHARGSAPAGGSAAEPRPRRVSPVASAAP